MNKVILNGVDLSIEDVVNVARNGYQVEIDKDCMAHIAEVRNYMESEWMRDDAPAVYGFNTGLGKHKEHKVTIEESDLHQYRTVLSHCGGGGDPAPEEVVRAARCVRLNAVCRGVSCIWNCYFSHLFQFQIITISPQALHIIFIKKTFNSCYLMTNIMACFTFCQNLLRERMIVTFLLIALPVQLFYI